MSTAKNLCALFALWAGKDIARWRTSKGQVVVHRSRRPGVVDAVDRDDDGLWVVVKYQNDDIREYQDKYFASAFVSMSLSPDLGAKIEREAGETYTRMFSDLSRKIESGLCLERSDLLWLGSGGHVQELERYLLLQRQAAERKKQRWGLATIGAFWRDAGMPERTIEVTADVMRLESSAIWTNRGGAFADLEKMQEAEGCARNAIACERKKRQDCALEGEEPPPESYHPYNLLGRIYSFLERPSDSEAAFAKARQLGAPEAQMLSAEKRGRNGRRRRNGQRPPSSRRRVSPDSELPEEEVPF